MTYSANEIEFPQIVFDTFCETVQAVLNINCVKVTDDMFKNFIENKIFTHIVMSKVIIAELSTENPNVIFELGQALALERNVIPTYYNEYGRAEKKLAFDYAHFDTIFYNDLNELKAKLTKSLEPYRD